jgi:diguanylate cyclase (GGDEF)-like protein
MCTYGYRVSVEDAPTARADRALARYRVLLVADDAEYGRMVERVLRSARPPLSVHREERLAAGLHRLERDHFDALVMDLKLPDATGRSTLENACAQASHLPVVVLTSTDDEGLALEAILGGAEDYLVKQRTHALTLPGALVRAIERHRRHGERAVGAFAGIADEVELLGQLARALARAQRRSAPLAVMVAGFADLDWLREAFVPEAIDRLVARAAERLALRVRGGDLLARLDSTRFAIVVEGDSDLDRRQLEQIAQNLRSVMQGLEIELGESVVMGLEAHIGISVHPEEGDDPETLLENAASAWEEVGPHGGVRFFSAACESP